MLFRSAALVFHPHAWGRPAGDPASPGKALGAERRERGRRVIERYRDPFALVAGVWLFNTWQERQLRRRTEEAFAREHPDVLLGGELREPLERVEPSINIEAEPLPQVAHAPAAVPPVAIDPVIDFVVEVMLPEPAAGAALRDELRQMLAETGKTILGEGYVDASGD